MTEYNKQFIGTSAENPERWVPKDFTEEHWYTLHRDADTQAWFEAKKEHTEAVKAEMLRKSKESYLTSST